MVTILVTGGAGYIGSHMVYAILDNGMSAVVLDDLSTGFRSAVPAAAPLVIGSVGDRALVGETISKYGVDAIIHFAASTVVPESVANPLAFYRNNTANSLALITAAVASGVRYLIFSSTAAVYGSVSKSPVTEDDLTCPISPYGQSKLMVETMLRDASIAHDLNYVALRYFNVAGADPRGRTGQSTKSATHLVKVSCQVALGVRAQLEIFGSDYPTPDGTCIRDYVHVSDLVQAHLQSLVYLQNGGESTVMNCGYGHGYSVLEVADAVRRVSGRDLPTVILGRRTGDPAAIAADTNRIRSNLDWKPVYNSLDAIISHALRWEKALQQHRIDGAR
jgi:UDP-glucose 4-epimerase